jgi:hypothetical protein
MRISIAAASGGTQHIQLHLSDFNRTRWVLFALRHHAPLRASLLECPQAEALLTDSTSPHLSSLIASPGGLPHGTHIVLWDGLNSAIELFDKAPALQARADLVYLPVGSFAEIEGAFPANHAPLMPARLVARGATPAAGAMQGTLIADVKATAQALLRPWKNRRTNAPADALLRQGGQLVFCGMVRPNQAVFENFFRGSSGHLRAHMAPLVGLEWRRPALELARIIQPCWQALRDTQPHTPADWACHYTWANVLHRMATLCHAHAMSAQLLVNEFGLSPHLDPYDATAYRHNQFIDFGSTRGPDLVYPRSVDLHLHHKPCTPSRLMAPGGSLATCLQSTTAPEFWALCEQHAQQQVQALAALKA